ncbi:xylulokinase [Sulfitobacter mediterraneus]|uniref:xylulokinase n=1 Tax=Sulfitobacter mediterraneus TaxID=83219 RepID=UPI0021A3FB16|nr:FGGY-family carbohydrate kinase [Sulfitobacter mediterraneus]UWR13415.1 FGGY-family carbohydrate kinase [Sulfitobacter mediterraneus]
MKDVLAYDLGGSSLRLAIVNSSNEVTKLVRRPLSITKGKSGEYEVDPAVWWDNFKKACVELADEGADLSSVGAVVGCGFTRTQVLLSEDGSVVHPAITFQDSRGSTALAEYLESASPDLPTRYSNLSPYHPVARLLWLKRNEPDVWAKVNTVVEPKDYLNFRLTGALVTDRISINASKSFFEAIEGDQLSLEALGFGKNILPRSISPFDEVGLIRDDLPTELTSLAGKPVICGSTDTWTCVLGSGGLNPGAAYNISGTSDVFGVISRHKHFADGLMTVQWGPEQWQLGGPSQGAASRLVWAVEKFMPSATIEEAFEKTQNAQTHPPIFLPFLEGERTPFWDADLRGAFIGIESSHSDVDFLQSVAEGINFLGRIILQKAEQATGEVVSHICFSGGLSNNPILCQLKADCLDRTVFVPDVKESGLVGSAAMAFVTSESISEITAGLLRSGSWFQPNPNHRDYFDQRFSVFEDACSKVAELSRRLSQLKKKQNVQGA